MYVPRAFAENDLEALQAQMLATPLPVLVTQGECGLIASHIPLLLNPNEGSRGTLYGHLARANRQWQALAEGAEAMVIFAGEQAYISPAFYPAKPNTPRVLRPGTTLPSMLTATPPSLMTRQGCCGWSLN